MSTVITGLNVAPTGHLSGLTVDATIRSLYFLEPLQYPHHLTPDSQGLGTPTTQGRRGGGQGVPG